MEARGKMGRWAAALLLAGSLAGAGAQAQGVPQAPAISSAQVTVCKPGQELGDYCGWGVWALETQRSVLIASLAESAQYLICREVVDPGEAKGYPLTVEADGVVVAGGTPPGTLTGSGTCFVASGKRIVLNGLAGKPNKQVRGYYIRLGGLFLANSVPWQIAKGSGASAPDRALLAQFSAPRAVRVCFGPYSPITGSPPQQVVKESQLLVDGSYAQLRPGENAVFNANSCTDVTARVVGVEPRWGAGDPPTASGRFAF